MEILDEIALQRLFRVVRVVRVVRIVRVIRAIYKGYQAFFLIILVKVIDLSGCFFCCCSTDGWCVSCCGLHRLSTLLPNLIHPTTLTTPNQLLE